MRENTKRIIITTVRICTYNNSSFQPKTKGCEEKYISLQLHWNRDGGSAVAMAMLTLTWPWPGHDGAATAADDDEPGPASKACQPGIIIYCLLYIFPMGNFLLLNLPLLNSAFNNPFFPSHFKEKCVERKRKSKGFI